MLFGEDTVQEFKVGDLVICEADNEIYLYLGQAMWDGWGRFIRLCDSESCSMVEIMFSKY